MTNRTIAIEERPLAVDEDILEILEAVPHMNFAGYNRWNKQELVGMFRTEIDGAKKRNYSPRMFVLREDDRPVGLVTMEKLEWDRSIFSVEMGRFMHVYIPDALYEKPVILQAALEAITKEFRGMNVRHISVKTTVNDWKLLHLLQKIGFVVMDTLIDFTCELKKEEVTGPGQDFEIRGIDPSNADEVEQTVRLCREVYSAFRYDRFHREPLFGEENATRLYTEWIRNQIRNPRDVVTVARLGSEVIGFMSMNLQDDLNRHLSVRFADFVLTGVSQASRGKNIFPKMMHYNLNIARGRKIDLIRGLTHVNNFSVHKSLLKTGFTPAWAGHTLHKVLM